MKTEALFAAIIRGSIIEKVRQSWVVAWESIDSRESTDSLDVMKVPESEVLRINLQNEDEAEKFISEGLNKFNAGKIPIKIQLKYKETDYSYLCAPDFEGINKIRRGEITESWDINKETLNASRAPVSGGDAVQAQTADFGASRSLVVKNRIVLVTGGAQGFGEEITRGLVSAGALVFIADLNIKGAENLADKLNGEQGKTIAFAAEVNVGDEASVEKMTERIALLAGGLDLCVSNAGVLRAAAILEQDIASFRFVTDINYTAFAIVTKHCGLLMRAQNRCAPSWTTDIIQINSKSGLDGSNKNGAYAGSKFGSIGLVQSFAKELVDYRIKVNAVCPGNFFDGPLWADPEKGLFVQYLRTGKVPGAKTIEEVKSYYEARVPMGRGCTGPDVIRAVLYLVEQVYETGQALPVTGGQVMLS